MFERVLALDGGHPDAWHFVARLDLEDGRAADALVAIRKAIAAYPRHAPLHVTEARIHLALGDARRAALAAQAAAGTGVDAPEHWSVSGGALVPAADVPRPAPSTISTRLADDASTRASGDPGSAKEAIARADALQREGRLYEAEAELRSACALDPADSEAAFHLASVLGATYRYDAAAEVYRGLLQLPGPAGARAVSGIAHALTEIGRTDEAREIAAAAWSKHPSLLRLALPALLTLKPVYADREDVARCRARYADGIATLVARHEDFLRAGRDENLSALARANFYLAYQGEDDLALQCAYGDFVASMLDALVPELRRPLPRLPLEGRRLRIGFASSYFYRCTAGAYFRNWIVGLDRSRFEVVVYHFRASLDEVGREIAARADRFRRFDDTAFAGFAIRDDELDVLVYPELGGHGPTFLLAGLRLAPVQCAGWGQPVTSGLATIDHFLSGDLAEPADAQSHYRERLVRLPGIGIDYAPPPFPPGLGRSEARRRLGLPEDAHLYLFPQSIYKIHPDNDELIARVLEADARGRLLLFAGHTEATTDRFLERLSARLRSAGVDIAARVTLLPIMPRETYLAVNAAADAMLDSLHWSGGGTSLDAFAVGLPVVTLPGRFMRGRQTLAMLRALDVPELVATDRDDYVALALRLGGDGAWRDAISRRILAGRSRLFEDRSAIRALERYFEAQVASDAPVPPHGARSER